MRFRGKYGIERKQAVDLAPFIRSCNRCPDDTPSEHKDYGSADERGEVSTDQYGKDEHLRGNDTGGDVFYEDRG